jgi:type II secretory pathway component PulJ
MDDQNIKKCINSKGDLCASPSRQVFQHDNCDGEPVDEVIIEQTEHQSHQETRTELSEQNITVPQTQHPLMQDGNKRHTKAERAHWRVANGLHERRSQAEHASEKHKRLGKLLWKDRQLTAQPPSSTEVPLTNGVVCVGTYSGGHVIM